jgi:hypothetical protein
VVSVRFWCCNDAVSRSRSVRLRTANKDKLRQISLQLWRSDVAYWPLTDLPSVPTYGCLKVSKKLLQSIKALEVGFVTAPSELNNEA